MTYTLTLTPYLAAQLAACCLHAGLDVCNIFPAHITRHTTPTEESPAVLTALGLPSTTTPAAVLPTQPRPSAPEAAPALPTGMGLAARVAWLEGQRNTTNNNKH